MPFNPKSEYTIVSDNIDIKDFSDYPEAYVTRPPYQRKAVWSRKKKQSLMDSLIRRYYVPRLVIREVRLDEDRTKNEIIDGQQRITTVQEFFANKFSLPASLADVSSELVGKFYKDLDVEFRMFIDRSIKYQADIIKNIEDPTNVQHQFTATEIFWRLQQGESLNYMEVAHAQLSSTARNYIVRFADDQTFDYEAYVAIDENSEKVKFFSLLNVDNSRMKHLQYMARFLMLEEGNGYADLSDRKVVEFIGKYRKDDGIGDNSFEELPIAKAVLQNLRVFYKAFRDDPMLGDDSGIKELSTEYFIISVYLLFRHIAAYYVIDDSIRQYLRDFVIYFHNRWKDFDDSSDPDLLAFSNRRQQGEKDLEARDRIMRQLFFEYAKEKGIELIAMDEKRVFSEHERIKIYRRDRGFCQQCLREGKPEKEASVNWSEYQADHVIPHSKGGPTTVENGELLCAYHNQKKSDSLPTEI